MTKFAQSGVLSNILLVEACEDLYDTAMWSSILETVVSGLLNITKLSDVSMVRTPLYPLYYWSIYIGFSVQDWQYV